MVIISVSVCTKNGKALVARQFRDISRIRVEGLLSAFPKLMDPNSEHTFVETDSVRYVYTPIETLYLIIITTKSSNIVEDLDTLQLVARAVKETCIQVTEEEVINQAFELMMAFDEMISMGFREKLDIEQVRTILEMESHEENLQELIKQSKEEDARLMGKREAARIAVDKAKNQGKYPTGIGSDSQSGPSFESSSRGSGGFGSTGTGSSGSSGTSGNVGKYTGFSSQSSSSYKGSSGSSSSSISQPSKPKSSMSLLPNKNLPKKNDLLNEIAKSESDLQFDQEEEETEDEQPQQQLYTHATPNRPAVQQKDIHIQVEEKFMAEVNHEGGAKVNVKGEMYLNIANGANGAIRVKLNTSEVKRDAGYIIKTNPKVDKSLYTNSQMLGLKQAKRPFPVGSVKVLTWRLQDAEEEALPFTVTCWPTPSEEGLSVNVEYELTRVDMELNNLVIAIPIPGTEVNVESIEHGTYKIDTKNSLFLWLLDDVSTENGNATGTMEFLVSAEGDESSTFPISVQFSSQQTLLPITVENVLSAVDNTPADYSSETIFSVAEYQIV